MNRAKTFPGRNSLAEPPPSKNLQPISTREIVLRFCLTTLAVIICYQFQWGWLRFLTSELQMRLDTLLGMPHSRLANDAVLWRGVVYQYVNACTFVDVWFGAVPLLWNVRRTIVSNLRRVLILAVVLFVFNVTRLSFSNVLFNVGIPWEWSHDAVGGICYFVVWVWLWNHAGWKGHVQEDKYSWNAEPELSSAAR